MTNTLKWLGTFTLIVGVVQFLQYLPFRPSYNVFRGYYIWVVVGYMWREYSIIITNLVLTMVS